MRAYWLSRIAAVLFGCTCGLSWAAPPAPGGNAASKTPPGITLADKENIYERVLRHMFEHNESALQQNARVFCISFPDGADPPSAFIARFKDNKIPVKPVSDCHVDGIKDGSGVRDKSNGERGIIFRVDAIHWIDSKHPVVNGGYHEGNVSGSVNNYYLERKTSHWKVIKEDEVHVVS